MKFQRSFVLLLLRDEAQGIGIAKNPYPSANIKGIDNVVLAGQWLNPPGGLHGAAIQGKYSIQRILKKEKRSIKI